MLAAPGPPEGLKWAPRWELLSAYPALPEGRRQLLTHSFSASLLFWPASFPLDLSPALGFGLHLDNVNPSVQVCLPVSWYFSVLNFLTSLFACF